MNNMNNIIRGTAAAQPRDSGQLLTYLAAGKVS